MSAALALQKAIRARLVSDPGVLALVPAGNIIDGHGGPKSFPAILIGEDLETASDLTMDRRHITVYLTLHAWSHEPGMTDVKAIVEAIRKAIQTPVQIEAPDRLIDLRFEAARFVRDVDTLTAHGVVTLEAVVEESLV